MKINLPQKPKIVKTEGNRTIFEIEGLYPGYGVAFFAAWSSYCWRQD